MQGRKQMAGRKGLTQSLKNTGMMNYQESKKLNSSVDKFKKEFEKKVRDLSVQQSVLLASQRKRDSRRGSLPSSPSIDFEDDKRGVGDELKSSFSDSALDQCIDNRTSSSTPSPLKLPSIATHKEKTGSRKIELEDITSIKTPKEMIFDKFKYSRQAKPTRLDAKDMTTKLSNGYSAMIIASPPITRSNRRISLQATHLSPLSMEDVVPNRTGIRLMRRGSCPSLGAKATVEKKLAGVEIRNGDSLEDQTSKFSREMKKCRYLRFPTSIREDDEENTDSVFIEK